MGYLQGCESSWTHVSACCSAPPNSPTDDKRYVCKKETHTAVDYRGYDWFDNGRPDSTANGTNSAELIRSRAVDFLARQGQARRQGSKKPFFLYLPFQNIHGKLPQDPRFSTLIMTLYQVLMMLRKGDGRKICPRALPLP